MLGQRVRVLVLVLWLLGGTLAQADQYAFLVAVQDYGNELTQLRYTENDVNALADALKALGYPEENITRLTQGVGAKKLRYLPLGANIRKELALLLKGLAPEDSLVLGFSGHGVQFKGDATQYYCPADAQVRDRSTLVSLTEIYRQLADPKVCRAGTKVLFVDACRDDPLTKLNKTGNKPIELDPVGLKRLPPPAGIAAFYSCSPGEQSWEDPELERGAFLNFVVEGLRGQADLDGDQEVTLAELEQFAVKQTFKYVKNLRGESQMPVREGETRGLVTLARLSPVKPLPPKPTPSPTPPSPGSAKPPALSAPFTTAQAKFAQAAWAKSLGKAVTEKNSLGMDLVLIPPGKFRMGSPAGEAGHDDDENPVDVTLTQPFWLARTEVTQGQWQQLMGTTPWKGQQYVKEGADYAATYVSWEDAEAFCAKLSQQDGQTYRLPTEAEWEWSCRAGTTSRFSFGDSDGDLGRYGWYGWYGGIVGDGNAKTEQYAHRVGLKLANPFGLSDMHGNVWEWCQDQYADKLTGGTDPVVTSGGSYRVYRGGSWDSAPAYCRSASRDWCSPDYRGYDLGFRPLAVQSR